MQTLSPAAVISSNNKGCQLSVYSCEVAGSNHSYSRARSAVRKRPRTWSLRSLSWLIYHQLRIDNLRYNLDSELLRTGWEGGELLSWNRGAGSSNLQGIRFKMKSIFTRMKGLLSLLHGSYKGYLIWNYWYGYKWK